MRITVPGAAGTVEQLPEIREDGSTRVPGVYVSGDLTGIPLLKFALDSGASVAARIARVCAHVPPEELARLEHLNLFGTRVSDAGLGAQQPNAPDLFVHDGKGRLLGTRSDYLSKDIVCDTRLHPFGKGRKRSGPSKPISCI